MSLKSILGMSFAGSGIPHGDAKSEWEDCDQTHARYDAWGSGIRDAEQHSASQVQDDKGLDPLSVMLKKSGWSG